jgi:[ribosomal protein S5]-alanine N-acetyltransferase
MKRLESERLYYREFEPGDAPLLFHLDSDPDVHTYLYDGVVPNIEHSKQVVAYVRKQYKEAGVGRMAAFEKATGEFIGWVGLKIEHTPVNGHSGFFDIGYRLLQIHWGKGYATEATEFFLDYAFNELNAEKVYAYAFESNTASRRVLEKCGLKHVKTFEHNGIQSVWYEIER